MTGTLEVTVKVYLQSDIDGNGRLAREVAQAIVDGERHPLVDHTELVEISSDDEESEGAPTDTRELTDPASARCQAANPIRGMGGAYKPFVDGRTVGLEFVPDSGAPSSFVFLNPSSYDDEGQNNVFVYSSIGEKHFESPEFHINVGDPVHE